MIIIISFLLDGIISNLVSSTGYFIPLLSLISLVIINYKNDNYYGYAILLGLLYDISYTDTLFLNCIIFYLMANLIVKLRKYLPYNLINQLIISLIIIITYRILTYFVLSIIGYVEFNIINLLFSIIKSVLLNLIYVVLIYLIKLLPKYSYHKKFKHKIL